MVRKTIALIIFFSFVLLVVSSFVLYIMPEGRVAYWGDWKFWGLNKPQWSAMHITGGFLFLMIGIWHAILNLRPLKHYMKKFAVDNSKPAPMLIAAVVVVISYAGILFEVPPMSYVMNFNEAVKKRQANNYGNPPFAHAELSSFEKFCSMLKLDLNATLEYLESKSFKGNPSKQSVLKDIAAANNMTPQQLYGEILNGLNAGDPFAALPQDPPEGTGKMTLKAVCSNFKLPIDEAIARFDKQGIKAGAEQTMRQIADKHSINPHELYAKLRTGK